MARYLLYDGGCARCGNFAQTIETTSEGWLQIRSLDEPFVQDLLSRARPNWKWRPMLVTVRGERTRVYAGFSMALRLGIGLGPRRAFRILTSAA